MSDIQHRAQTRAISLNEIERLALAWQDRSIAIYHISEKYIAQNNATIKDAMDALSCYGVKPQLLHDLRRVGKKLLEEPKDEQLWAQRTFDNAREYLARKTEKAVSQLKVKLMDVELPQYFGEEQDRQTPLVQHPFLCVDFNQWASEYTGEPFSVIHCDFPYEPEDVYWELLDGLLAYKEKLFAERSHLICWCANNAQTIAATVKRLENAELRVITVPLVWFHSDNVGIIPDCTREPRRVYDTAMLASYGDRKLLESVANVYAGPTYRNTRIHQNEKPVPMLHHFLRMVLGEMDSLLDPTCGLGSVARAALKLAPRRVVMLDKSQTYIDAAIAEWEAEYHRVQYAKRLKS